MAMTDREVIEAAIHFGTPDRLPTSDDTCSVRTNHNAGGHRPRGGEQEDYHSREVYDDFGCLWQRSEVHNMGQVKGHPLQDWDALKTYRWPNPDDPFYYEEMEERFTGSEGKYVMTSIGLTLWERLWMLRGMEQVLIELHTDPARPAYLADRIVEYDLAIIHNIGQRFPGRIHGVQLTDDWGTQEATFINPRLWREFFQPRYARIFEAAHAQGWDTWIHSDGKINEIIQPWIDAGLDVINMPAPRMVGIEEVGQRFAGKICFSNGVDNQATLPFAGPDEIRAEVQLLLKLWATPQGGFIGPGHGFITSRSGEGLAMYGLPLESVLVMLEAFHEYDPYRHRQ